jgi:hypothetical protein
LSILEAVGASDDNTDKDLQELANAVAHLANGQQAVRAARGVVGAKLVVASQPGGS